jgi:hypothetical protein
MMGRYIGCWAGGFVGRGFGSLIAYIEASKMCGSTVIVHVPSFVIDSLGGLFGGCSVLPFLFTGFVQYFSNMPSLSHFCRDLCNESGRTPLCHQSVSHRRGKTCRLTFQRSTGTPLTVDLLVEAH